MSTAADTAPHSSSFNRSLFDDPGVLFARVEKTGDEPAADKGVVDVAVLDMNHGWANLGHESIVETLLALGRLERLRIGPAAPSVRVISYNLREHGAIPASPASRFAVVVGTGGPGALDPRLNDGVSEGSQGVLENPAWESPLWRFFDEVLATKTTALLGVCHSFGLLARWSGVARAVSRHGRNKAKSTGVVRNVLAPSARNHPWFKGLYETSGGPVIEVLDSRLFDLVPTGTGPGDLLAYEVNEGTDEPGEAVTMVELARDEEGVLPRVWGVNHHPEIGDRGLQRQRLARLEARGEVSPGWVAERRAALEAWNASAQTERHLQTTAAYTFERPLRHLIGRAAGERVSRFRRPAFG